MSGKSNKSGKNTERRQQRRAAKRISHVMRTAAAQPPPAVPVSASERAPELLNSLAAVLNECESAGLLPTLAHGAVITEYGYVFWIPSVRGVSQAGKSWQVRTRQLTELIPSPAPDDEL